MVWMRRSVLVQEGDRLDQGQVLHVVAPGAGLVVQEVRPSANGLTTFSASKPLLQIDDVARKAAKAGGAEWTDELRARARKVYEAVRADAGIDSDDDVCLGVAVAFALDALEAWLAARRADAHDSVRRWPTLHVPKTINWEHLVEIVHHDPALPEVFVGPEHERRQRQGFSLTDRRMRRREVEAEIDYCMLCHDRGKDSCSKGMVDAKTGALKKNPIGVALAGCPLEEKISEMHAMRQAGEHRRGHGPHRDRQPHVPGHGAPHLQRLHEGLHLPEAGAGQHPAGRDARADRDARPAVGAGNLPAAHALEPAQREAPALRPYNGKNVLVVGLGPAGYTLAHHLACEGFGVVAVDGLKVEPLDARLVGTEATPPTPVKIAASLYGELTSATCSASAA